MVVNSEKGLAYEPRCSEHFCGVQVNDTQFVFFSKHILSFYNQQSSPKAHVHRITSMASRNAENQALVYWLMIQPACHLASGPMSVSIRIKSRYVLCRHYACCPRPHDVNPFQLENTGNFEYISTTMLHDYASIGQIHCMTKQQ